MTTALLLVDLQADFLASPGLVPAPGELIDRVEALLTGWRARGEPIVHVWTTVTREDDRRMPHWREAGLWRCELGTAGHAPPPSLAPRNDEPVVHKTDFSGFEGTTLAAELATLGVTGVILAGTHMHACVRETALGAYARRLGVTVAVDAVASDDPEHAGLTRAWMSQRGVRFATVDRLLAEAGTTAGPAARLDVGKRSRAGGLTPDGDAPGASPIVVGLLGGEGIGPQLTEAGARVLEATAERHGLQIEIVRGPPVGGRELCAPVGAFVTEIFAHGGAVLAGAVGGRFVYDLRREHDLFCKLVPVRPWTALARRTPFRREHLDGVDLILVRENASGLYQGHSRRDGERVEHTFGYALTEVERIIGVAAQLAADRRGGLAVVVKDSGVPDLSALWREAAATVCAPLEIEPTFVDVDRCAYELVRSPAQWDVLVAPNLYGDVLADVSALLLGGREVSYSGNFNAAGSGVYQTNHGSALDLTGTDRANPVGQISAAAMLLRNSFDRADAAQTVLDAVDAVWRAGWHTADTATPGDRVVGTAGLTDRIAEAVRSGEVRRS